MAVIVAILAIAGVLALYGIVIGIGAFVLSWAWNLVIPSTFNGPVLDFGAAFALIVIIVVIRGFFGGGSKSS